MCVSLSFSPALIGYLITRLIIGLVRRAKAWSNLFLLVVYLKLHIWLFSGCCVCVCVCPPFSGGSGHAASLSVHSFGDGGPCTILRAGPGSQRGVAV